MIENSPTLLDLAGYHHELPVFAEAVLVLIDYQNEYLTGPLALPAASAAVAKALDLLRAARYSGTRIVHVAHKGPDGGLFDRTSERGAFISDLAPLPSESIIEKPRPNAFSGTDLAKLVANRPLILAGFMTHMCVSSTARAAIDLGFMPTIAADACATRDLKSLKGLVPANALHDAELAALSDRFALITTVSTILTSKASI